MSQENKAIKFVFKLKKKLDYLTKFKNQKKILFKSKKKNTIDPVTQLDIKIEKFIRNSIKENFSTHSIVGEEFKNKLNNSDFKWFIDPIDGTKNLVMGIPTWSNLIGLHKREESILSFANFPELNKYYFAYKNKCFVNKDQKFIKIYSNQKSNFRNAKMVINTLRTVKEKKISRLLKRFPGIFKITGTDALNFCLIAEGKIDVLIERGLKKVDFYPLISIIKNSGGIITDWNGEMKFSRGDVLVCANKNLHKHFLKEIKKK